MPLHLEGSCRCRAVRFSIDSHTPYPYQLCYCSICRKTAGGGGFAINIMGNAASPKIRGKPALAVYRAEIEADGAREVSTAQRHFCRRCGSALWVFDPAWPDLVHPFASAIDTALPIPPERVHLMLRYKAPWVEPQLGPTIGALKTIRSSRSRTGTAPAACGSTELRRRAAPPSASGGPRR